MDGDDVTFVHRIRAKGVQLWAENGQLYYRAPKGSLTPAEVARLRTLSQQLAMVLGGAGRDAGHLSCRSAQRWQGNRAPLSYGQVAALRGRQDGERAVKEVAFAMRLRGRLDVALLQESLLELTRRQDALRTRIITIDAELVQEIVDSVDYKIAIDDLRGMSVDARQLQVRRLVHELISEPFTIDVAPLFGVRLARLQDDEYVLMVAFDHIVSDGWSLHIFFQELFTMYAQGIDKRPSTLPPLRMQFADFAIRQRAQETSWIEENGEYWQELIGCPPLKFPESGQPDTTDRQAGWRTVSIHIEREFQLAVQNWCKTQQTTIVMGVFAAYAILVLHWCKASGGVIRYAIDSRTSPDVQSTVGMFASPMYFRLRLENGDSWTDMLHRVTREYCAALARADFWYMEAHGSAGHLATSNLFNWIPQRLIEGLCHLSGLRDPLTCSAVPFNNPVAEGWKFDADPSVWIYDGDAEMRVDVLYAPWRFSARDMDRFARHLLTIIDAMVRAPRGPVMNLLPEVPDSPKSVIEYELP